MISTWIDIGSTERIPAIGLSLIMQRSIIGTIAATAMPSHLPLFSTEGEL